MRVVWAWVRQATPVRSFGKPALEVERSKEEGYYGRLLGSMPWKEKKEAGLGLRAY